MIEEKGLKERFDEAFKGLIDANKRQLELCEKITYAGKLIELNKAKQKHIKTILGVRRCLN